MFFGRSEPEKVSPEGLEELLSALFEKKIGQFEPRARRILENMGYAREEFIKACDGLEKLEAEPYTEDLYFASVSSIKGQKVLYTKAIRRIASEMKLDAGEGATSYARYQSALASIENAIGEMLKTNASFRTVVYSYSNHFAPFKRAFAGIERNRDELRRELGSRSREAGEYAELKEEIYKFITGIEELKTLVQSIAFLEGSAGRKGEAGAEDEEGSLLKNLEAKRKEFSEIAADAARLSEKISLLTAPLERPARKQDHLSLNNKVALSSFIYDPINKINGESQYGEFVSLLGEMKENIEKGAIDTKNREGVLESVSALLNSDIYSTIKSFNSLQEKKAVVGEEIRMLERTDNELKKGRDSAEKLARDINSMREEAEAVRKTIGLGKASIEKLFLEYYRKHVTILRADPE